MIDTNIRDWHLFLNISLPQVVAVQADSPYQTFDALLEAFKKNPGKITVSSAGINSAGHSGIETIKKYTGISYKHITYDGGNPAVIAVVAGEAEVVTQLSSEETDMLKAGKLRALAVVVQNFEQVCVYPDNAVICGAPDQVDAVPVAFSFGGMPDCQERCVWIVLRRRLQDSPRQSARHLEPLRVPACFDARNIRRQNGQPH